MIVRRVGPLSLAKVAGVVYATLGFVVGCLFALFSLLGGFASDQPGGPFFGMLFGAGAVIFMPIMYGVLGFLASLLMAAIYNVVAGWVGGVRISLEPGAPGASPGTGA